MKKKAIILPPERKRTVPSNAFQPGNKFAFVKGKSGNPGGEGRPRDPYRLVSKALRHQLNTRATNEAAMDAGLEPGASWSQVIAAVLLRLAAKGDIAAVREIREFTEGSRGKLEITGADGEPLQPPALNIVVVPHTGASRMQRPQPVAPRLPARERQSFEMLDGELAERAAAAVVAAVKAGKPRSAETVNRCLPDGWVLDPTSDVAGLQQATSAAHWTELLRAGAVPQQ